MSNYIPIIGLEIHVRLKTQSKMFCRCPNVPEDTPPNTAVCPVCTGQPGALPVINSEAVRLGVRAGLALGCTIHDHSHFDRKNYFYPDLPKGYQISQFDFPIAERGTVTIDMPNVSQDMGCETRNIRITRAHLEEDAAKNIHDSKTGATLVDFNRAGTPLLEIVTEPDIRSPEEAKTFLQELQTLLRAIYVSDADMEKGYMRCDANISLLPVDQEMHPLIKGLGPKVEVKNINSFRFVERALAYEIKRQTGALENGDTVEPATRGWNETSGQTVEQRLKETSSDYRYFPEPDLPPLELATIRDVERNALPELPREKRLRLMDEYGFSLDDAHFLVANDGWAKYAESVMSEFCTYELPTGATQLSRTKLVSGWLTSRLTKMLAERQLALIDIKIAAENFAEFLSLVEAGKINSTNAQKLLGLMLDNADSDPSHLMEQYDLGQSDDPQVIVNAVTQLIEQNPDKVAQIKMGKHALIKWFVGSVMKSTEGRANPLQAEEEVKKQLGV